MPEDMIREVGYQCEVQSELIYQILAQSQQILTRVLRFCSLQRGEPKQTQLKVVFFLKKEKKKEVSEQEGTRVLIHTSLQLG